MHSLKTLALAGAVFAGATAVASAADLGPPPIAEVSGWYLRGDIGVGQLDGKFEVLQAGVPTTRGTHDSINSTFFGGGGIGYQFNSYLRADVTGELRGSAPFGYKDTFCFDNARGACGAGRPPSGNGVQGINSISLQRLFCSTVTLIWAPGMA
jgi:opacity protein-like surface antigen